jgi:hypothetical protein
MDTLFSGVDPFFVGGVDGSIVLRCDRSSIYFYVAVEVHTKEAICYFYMTFE